MVTIIYENYPKCGDSIILHLKIIFESPLKLIYFSDSWKKGNIIPVHKENKI